LIFFYYISDLFHGLFGFGLTQSGKNPLGWVKFSSRAEIEEEFKSFEPFTAIKLQKIPQGRVQLGIR